MSTVDLGKQQVTIYPYQDLTSLNGDQILYKLFHEGSHHVALEVVDANVLPGGSSFPAGTFDIVVRAGTTLLFERSVEDYMDPDSAQRPAIIKVVVSEDTYITNSIHGEDPHFTKADYYYDGVEVTTNFLFVYATWGFDISSSTNYFASFHLALGDTYEAIRDIVDSKGNHTNIILGKLLNNPLESTIAVGDVNRFSISYEPGEGRDWWTKSETTTDNFLVEFSGNGQSVTVKTGEMWLNTTYASPTAASISPPPALSTPAGNFQIDVLGYKYSADDPVDLRTRLVWSSFSFAIDPTWSGTWSEINHKLRTQEELKAYLHDKRLELVDDQYVILFLIRRISSIPATPVIWPDWCVIPHALVPRIGTVSRYSKVNIPVI